MQEFLSRVVNTLAERLEDVQSIVLQGSQTDPEIVDMWSDYDLLVVLKPDACIDEAAFTEAIHRIGRVVGRETHRQQNTLLYRTALQWQSSVDLLDAKVRTYQNWTGDRPSTPPVILFDGLRTAASKKSGASDGLPVSPTGGDIDATWFKYFMAGKKFCRHDNLIGMHLLLDLVRAYLVCEMIARDNRLRTTIHRRGQSEHLPDPVKLTRLDETDTQGVLDYLSDLAHEYDGRLLSTTEGYTSRYLVVQDYIVRSKAHLSQ